MAKTWAHWIVNRAYALDQIRFEVEPNTTRISETLIESICESKRRMGQVVERKPLYRVLSAEPRDDSLILKVVLSDYGENLALQQDPAQPNGALAVCGMCRCPEGYLIERRSLKVAAAPGLLHLTPAGTLEPGESVLDCLRREAYEELGLTSHELEPLDSLGVLRVEPLGVCQIVAPFRTAISLPQIQARPRPDSWESDGLMPAPADPDALRAWLEAHQTQMTSASVLVLCRELDQRLQTAT